MTGESRDAGRRGDPSWWSTGSVPADLPSWARRGLTETPDELAPSAPAPPPGRHRRGAVPPGSRLRGWGLAAASVAVAAAAVPLAISTLASDDNVALPRVGTFPVVAPNSLDPAPAAPRSAGRAPAAARPADAATLPDLQDPASLGAAPAASVAPRAVTRRAAPTTASTTTTTRDTTATTTPEVDATPQQGPDDSEDSDEGASGGSGGGDDASDGGGSGGSGGSGGGSGSGSSGGSGGGGDDDGGGADSPGLVGGLTGAVDSLLR